MGAQLSQRPALGAEACAAREGCLRGCARSAHEKAAEGPGGVRAARGSQVPLFTQSEQLPPADGDGTRPSSTQHKQHSGSCDVTEYLLPPRSHRRLLTLDSVGRACLCPLGLLPGTLRHWLLPLLQHLDCLPRCYKNPACMGPAPSSVVCVLP